MVRVAILVAFALAAQSGLFARNGSPDRIFDSIPFSQWLEEKTQAPIHWSLRISNPALSAHQRIGVTLDAQVDGAEMNRRRGEGKLLVLVQVSDRQRRVWQNHQEANLQHIEEGLKSNNVVFSQSFFVLPGDYRVAVALFDTASREHSLIKRSLHVAPLKNDPLPDMWHDLPPVEFFVPDSAPDRWFLPAVAGRLRIPVETPRPVDVNLLVNLTPAERLSASSRVQNRNLGALLPSTRVLSEVEWLNAKFSIDLLDLARRHVAFHQDDMQLLDWPSARGALTEVNPGIIDVKSLADRRFNAEFFLNQVARKVQAPLAEGTARVVIILSASVFFEPGVEMHPIAIAARPGVTVFYIRYQPQPPTHPLLPDVLPPQRPFGPPVFDQLEPLLKPLAPRLFEVATPREFRRSLAAVLAGITKL